MERTLWIGVLTVLCGLAASQHDGHDHEHGQDPFTAVLHLLGGDENQNLTLDMSTSLVKTMLDRVRCLRLEADEDSNFTCAECLTADGLIELSLGGPTDIVDEEGFHKMAVVLTVYLTALSAQGVCTEDPGGKGYQTMEDNLMRYTQSRFTLSSYQQVLKDINTNYRVENWGKCFTAESVFEELHINTSEASGGASYAELREIAAITVANVLEGLCIGEAELPEKSFFVDSLFKSLNVTNGTITVEALEHILSAFGIGGEAPPEPPVVDDGHDHAGHDHRRRRDLPPLTREDEHDHNHSHEHTEDFHHTCFNSAQLMKLFLVEAEMGVTSDQFSAMAPALLQQVYSGVCVGETLTPNTTAAPVVGELTMLEKYGYGTLSVVLISLLALIGLLVLPMAGSSVYKFIVQLGVGLGVGALSADALLHLLPQALGLHGDHAAHADHDHGAEDIAYMWKLLVAMGGIYFFFVFERVMSFIMPGGHGHSHGYHEEEHVHEDVQLKKMSQLPPEPSMGSKSLSISKQQLTNGQSTTTLDVFPESEEADTPNCCSAGCTPTAMMIVFSDTLHNLTDGLALGIAFSGDLAVGLSTSIAVLAHELPHELGDFAMLIRCGMSYKGALLWNLFAACWCFVGLYIGLAIGASFEVRQWLFALIAGMFLYVSLVDMLPELLHHKSKSPIATFVGQNIGFLLGVAALVALAMYEEQIQLAITLG